VLFISVSSAVNRRIFTEGLTIIVMDIDGFFHPLADLFLSPPGGCLAAV
jgi:hypothetical protein